MTDYYQPTLLFRKNAIKRFRSSLMPIVETEATPKTWMLQGPGLGDTLVLNQTCSLNRLHIKSNYWKIPDSNNNLTALAATNKHDDIPLLAISSGNSESNLFIYELDLMDNYLTHHNTISLPNIHGMQWVPQSTKHLVTGNSKGYAHLVRIPNIDDQEDSAEIVKRFNHRKHLKSINKDPSIFSHRHTNITKLAFAAGSEDMFSIYDDTLFLWDLNDSEAQARPKPIMLRQIEGLRNLDPSALELVVGICGRFGVSLLDTRSPRVSVPESAMLAKGTFRQNAATIMKWCDNNEYVFAAGHMDGAIRLWDIRKQSSFSTMKGHQGHTITSLEWNNNDLFSGGDDGNIVHWDLTSDVTDFSEAALDRCGLKEGISSVRFNTKKNAVEQVINERQCGTVLPASNTRVTAMAAVGQDSDLKILSIDGSSLFGMHSKIYDVVNVKGPKEFYTKEDLDLVLATGSNNTLVASSESLVEPLSIKRFAELSHSSKSSLSMVDSEVSSILTHESLRRSDSSCLSVSQVSDALSGIVCRRPTLREHNTSAATSLLLRCNSTASQVSDALSGIVCRKPTLRISRNPTIRSNKTAATVFYDAEEENSRETLLDTPIEPSDFAIDVEQFTFASSDMFAVANNSAYSVDSTSPVSNSDHSMFSDSLATLSTNTTICESPERVKGDEHVAITPLEIHFDEFTFDSPYLA